MVNISFNTLFLAKNIHQCFKWIYFLLYYNGCSGIKLRNDVELYYTKWSTWYGYMFRIIILIGYLGGIIIKIQDDELFQAMIGHLSPVVKIILCFECLISIVTYLDIVFIMDSSRQKQVQLANKLQTLDEQLLKDFPGVRWNYHKCARKYNFLTFFMYAYYTVVSSIYIFNLAHCACGWLSSFTISLAYSSITAVPGFVGFLYVANMDLLRLRFRLIQKLIRQNFTTSTKSQQKVMDDLRKFKILENYFKEYSSLILTLNDVFALAGAGSIFHDFTIMTSMGYVLCSKALESKSPLYEYAFIILFIVPRVYKVSMTAIYGYSTQKEKINCSHEFVKMDNYFNKSRLVRDNMQSFLHWRMQNTYVILFGKSFQCSLSLIFLILNSIANYILILIQLQFQQNNIVNRLNILEDVEIIKT